jgi:hypothetical protein
VHFLLHLSTSIGIGRGGDAFKAEPLKRRDAFKAEPLKRRDAFKAEPLKGKLFF